MAIYVREDFTSERCEFNIDSDLELLWIKLKQPACTVAIGAIYHPPKPIYKTCELLDVLEHTIDCLSNQCDYIVLSGDINSLDNKVVTERTGLVSLVKAPTRGTSVLDQIFVSCECYMNLKVVKPVLKTDHSAIIAYNGDTLANQNKSAQKCLYRKRSPKGKRKLFKLFIIPATRFLL